MHMVSVLINNHNYGDYVGEAIESVLNQTYKDFEIIVVDGDSSDHSRSVIMSYVEKYPKLITAVFKPTSGQAAAFNVGFKLSKGDIIAFLDSDDYFYNNKLQKIVELHDQYEFVGHARKALDINGILKDCIAPMDDIFTKEALFHKYGYIYTYNLITSCISVKRTILDKILPMPEDDYVTFADCYVKVMAENYCNIFYCTEALSFYRIHPVQRNKEFKNEESANDFVVDLYNRVFHDINRTLDMRGEEKIPTLTSQRLHDAFLVANPTTNIQKDKCYAIYGAGINSYKIRNIINLIGGKVIMVTDTNEKKWGTLWNGLEILSPKEVIERRNEYEQIVIGTTCYFNEVSEILQSYGLHLQKDFSIVTSLPND